MSAAGWPSRPRRSGVEIYPGFACSDVLYGDDGAVRGVVAGVFGIAKDGTPKPDYEPGMELIGKYVFLAEGVRGSLAKEIIARFDLSEGREPQKFGLGMKELWEVQPENHARARSPTPWAGRSARTPAAARSCTTWRTIWSRSASSSISTTRTPISTPTWNSSASSTTRWSSRSCEGGRRVAYGARAITEGGLQSVPKLYFPGGALIGCAAGFVNVPRIKGSHNAMKSGMLAAEAAFAAMQAGRAGDELADL